MILLVYNSFMGDTVIFTYVFKIYLSWIYLFHHFPSSPHNHIRTISIGFILLFSYMEKKPHIHLIYPHSPFPCAYPTPTGTHSWKRFIFPSCSSLKKKIVQGAFALVLHECIYHAFIKLTPFPPLLTHSL
jgi:hypothetical protein